MYMENNRWLQKPTKLSLSSINKQLCQIRRFISSRNTQNTLTQNNNLQQKLIILEYKYIQLQHHHKKLINMKSINSHQINQEIKQNKIQKLMIRKDIESLQNRNQQKNITIISKNQEVCNQNQKIHKIRDLHQILSEKLISIEDKSIYCRIKQIQHKTNYNKSVIEELQQEKHSLKIWNNQLHSKLSSKNTSIKQLSRKSTSSQCQHSQLLKRQQQLELKIQQQNILHQQIKVDNIRLNEQIVDDLMEQNKSLKNKLKIIRDDRLVSSVQKYQDLLEIVELLKVKRSNYIDQHSKIQNDYSKWGLWTEIEIQHAKQLMESI